VESCRDTFSAYWVYPVRELVHAANWVVMVVVKRTARECEIARVNRLVVEDNSKRPIPGRVQSFVWFSAPVGVIFYSKRGHVGSFSL